MNFKTTISLIFLALGFLFTIIGIVQYFIRLRKAIKESGFWFSGLQLMFDWQFQKYVLITVVFIFLAYLLNKL